MTTFKSDNRKFYAVLALGILLATVGCLTFRQSSILSTLLLLSGLLFLTIGLFKRELVSIDSNVLTIKNRLNLLPKKIPLEEIRTVRIEEKPLPLLASNKNILSLFLWDKKFKQVKNIKVLGNNSLILFIIDGQAIENGSYVKLIKRLKK